jgi:hypothetical protein
VRGACALRATGLVADLDAWEADEKIFSHHLEVPIDATWLYAVSRRHKLD